MSTKLILHPKEDFDGMHKAGKLASSVLDAVYSQIQPGVSTQKLNDFCHDMIIAADAIPAPLGYRGFPKSICTSINNVICHGIPSEKDILRNGDIVNIDVTVILDGWHGDSSRMYLVGKCYKSHISLCQVTYDALMIGIDKVKPGNDISDIGTAIEEYVTKYGYSSVRDYCGHGLGRAFHCEPNVPHYHSNDEMNDDEMKPGMFFTIEPMINEGDCKTKLNNRDKWTVTTLDCGYSAQWEHSIGVTESGVQIFTASNHMLRGIECDK